MAQAVSDAGECQRRGVLCGSAVDRPVHGETLTVGDANFALGDELVMGGGYQTERVPGQPDTWAGEIFFAGPVQLLADER